jgi:hypothetical protein
MDASVSKEHNASNFRAEELRRRQKSGVRNK